MLVRDHSWSGWIHERLDRGRRGRGGCDPGEFLLGLGFDVDEQRDEVQVGRVCWESMRDGFGIVCDGDRFGCIGWVSIGTWGRDERL
jgi:hypothetical protein